VEIKIITPEKTVLQADNVEQVLLPAQNGEVGILTSHIPMICALKVGRIRVDLPTGSVDLATSGGFAEVLDDLVTVLADTAERSSDIDLERARKARHRAEERLRRQDEKTDYARAQLAMSRALNRLKIAGVE